MSYGATRADVRKRQSIEFASELVKDLKDQGVEFTPVVQAAVTISSQLVSVIGLLSDILDELHSVDYEVDTTYKMED